MRLLQRYNNMSTVCRYTLSFCLLLTRTINSALCETLHNYLRLQIENPRLRAYLCTNKCLSQSGASQLQSSIQTHALPHTNLLAQMRPWSSSETNSPYSEFSTGLCLFSWFSPYIVTQKRFCVQEVIQKHEKWHLHCMSL